MRLPVKGKGPRPGIQERGPIVFQSGGREGIRTPDLRRAKAALSQLSYPPILSRSLLTRTRYVNPFAPETSWVVLGFSYADQEGTLQTPFSHCAMAGRGRCPGHDRSSCHHNAHRGTTRAFKGKLEERVRSGPGFCADRSFAMVAGRAAHCAEVREGLFRLSPK